MLTAGHLYFRPPMKEEVIYLLFLLNKKEYTCLSGSMCIGELHLRSPASTCILQSRESNTCDPPTTTVVLPASLHIL